MQRHTFFILFISLLLSSLILAGSGNFKHSALVQQSYQETPVEPAVTVEMTNTMKFTPDTVRIETGETVKWGNTSLLAHSVTGDPSQSTVEGSAELPDGANPFDSGMLDPKQTFEHTFEVPGTYQYFCIPHEGPKMFGWVIVEE